MNDGGSPIEGLLLAVAGGAVVAAGQTGGLLLVGSGVVVGVGAYVPRALSAL